MNDALFPTRSSEIVHLISGFADALESLPPSLSRSLSDLKELDAVLSGSLQSIATKLALLQSMMTPDSESPAFTPLQRLQLLREVTEDTKTFRLGGEDKVRVTTGTCETIATHTTHLSTLTSLLLSFLPSELLPSLPAPTAPHGYPSSTLPATALARRQAFDYPPSGVGSTVRLNAAHGMVREHWDLTRGSAPGARAPSSRKKTHHHHGGVPAGGTDTEFFFGVQATGRTTGGGGGGGAGGAGGGGGEGGVGKPTQRELKEKDPTHRHPNQYTKKKMAAGDGGSVGGYGGAGARSGGEGSGMTAVDSVKAKKLEQAISSGGGTSSRSGAGGAALLYPGMATAQEYAAATAGGRSQKRKVEDSSVLSKRKRTRPDISPDVTPQTLPTPSPASGSKSLRRTTLKVDDTPVTSFASNAALLGADDDGEADDEPEADGDGQTYCFCERGSFGEMIGCDGDECHREWFHLGCVGLQSIPKGNWLCDDCRDLMPKKRR